jgi:hypothetical protein
MAGCAAFCYLKGTLFKSLLMLMAVVLANSAAFGYFETLAGLLLKKGNINSGIAAWSFLLAFLLLFVIIFSVLQALIERFADVNVETALYPERIARTVCGLILGLLISGTLINAAAMAPVDGIPYSKFTDNSFKIENAKTPFLNTETFTSGWAGLLSRTSFSRSKSQAVFHPDFTVEQFANKIAVGSGVSTISSFDALEAPQKAAVWIMPEGITQADGNPVTAAVGKTLYIVRTGIRKNADLANPFTFSQLRVVCKGKNAADSLGGKGINAYPYGYIATSNTMKKVSFDDTLNVQQSVSQGAVKWIDLVYQVPENYVPVLITFKKNLACKLPEPVGFEKAPELKPFGSATVKKAKKTEEQK